MFVVFKTMIAVNECTIAFQHICLALPTRAAPAQVGRFHTQPFNRFQQAFMRANLHRQARLCQAHRKRFAGFRCEEFFVMYMGLGPTSSGGCFAHPVNHPFRATDIKMRANRLTIQ